jgi:hypothetical protein
VRWKSGQEIDGSSVQRGTARPEALAMGFSSGNFLFLDQALHEAHPHGEQAIRSSAISSAEPTMAGLAAAEPHPADDAPQRPRLGTPCRQGLDRRADRIIPHIADWLAQLVAREVDAGGAGEMRQRALDAGVLVIFPALRFGLGSRAADHGSAVLEDQDVARVAPMRRSAGADCQRRYRG